MKLPLSVVALLSTAVAAQDSPIARLLATRVAADGPGAIVAIVENGELGEVHVRGLADVDTEEPIHRESRFYLASASKQFTAACVHALVRDGKIGLDDDVREYVPELPDYGDRITVRHLIHHRSGLRGYLELMALAGLDLDAAHDPDAVLELICRQRELNFTPGTEFRYSNTGYFLMAVIVERVSKQSLREFARERLFEPLGMTASFRNAPDLEIADVVVGHEPTRTGHRAVRTEFSIVGSGGLVASVDDLAKWVIAQDRGGILDREFTRSLEQPIELRPEQGRNPQLGHYAAGLLVGEMGGRRVVWHPGGSFGFNTAVLRFPDDEVAVIALTNSAAGGAVDIAMAAAEHALGASLRPTPPASPAETPRPGTHFFTQPRTGEILVAVVGARSKLATANWDVSAHPVNATTLRSVGTPIPVTAELIRDGDRTDLRVTLGEQTPFSCTGWSAETVAEADVRPLAGSWHSDELDATLEIETRGTQLRFEDRLPQLSAPFRAMRRDLLITNEGFRIDVERNGDGEPVRLRISTKGVRGVVFTRS